MQERLRRTRRATTAGLACVVLGLAACSGDGGNEPVDPASSDGDEAADTGPDETAEADAPDDEFDDGERAADAGEAAEDEVADEVADEGEDGEVAVCDLVDVEQVAALLDDVLREPRAAGAAGNMLGSCSWTADNNGRTLSIWAWPVSTWDEMIATDDFGVGEIDGVGVRAERTSDGGLLADPGGRHYFFQGFVIDTDGSINLDLGQAGVELAIG